MNIHDNKSILYKFITIRSAYPGNICFRHESGKVSASDSARIRQIIRPDFGSENFIDAMPKAESDRAPNNDRNAAAAKTILIAFLPLSLRFHSFATRRSKLL